MYKPSPLTSLHIHYPYLLLQGETSKNEGATTTKRSLEPNGKAVPTAKKIKIEHEPKKLLLLSLIKKSSPKSSKRGTESPLTDPICRDDQEPISGKVKVEPTVDIGLSDSIADGKGYYQAPCQCSFTINFSLFFHDFAMLKTMNRKEEN